MHSWGKLWTIRYKKTENPTAASKLSGAKAGYCAWFLHTTPPRGWANYLSHPSGPNPPSTHLRDQLSGSEQGNLLLVFAPSCCSLSPSKALPEFLIWPLVNFYWLKSSRTQVCNSPSGWNPAAYGVDQLNGLPLGLPLPPLILPSPHSCSLGSLSKLSSLRPSLVSAFWEIPKIPCKQVFTV